MFPQAFFKANCTTEIKVPSVLGCRPLAFFRGVPACPSAGASPLTFTFPTHSTQLLPLPSPLDPGMTEPFGRLADKPFPDNS